MANDFYQKARALLQKHGFMLVRQTGSHQIWKNSAGAIMSLPATVPSRHTVNAALKRCGINEKI